MVVQRGRILTDWVIRHGFPILIAALCLRAILPHLDTLSLSGILTRLAALSGVDWGLATLFTMLSFLAVGQYDVIARRELGLPSDPKRAQRDGMAAVAVSQTLGFGLVTGTLARCRLRAALSLVDAGKITALVTVYFTIGLVIAIACVCLVAPTPVPVWLAGVVLISLAIATGFFVLWRPRLQIKQMRVHLPHLRSLAAGTGWAIVDITAAFVVFCLVLPGETAVSLALLLPAFYLALAAGILSGAPGGVGPFELVLFALAGPTSALNIPAESLLTAIFGFRLVYYVIPAVFGAAFVLTRQRPRPTVPAPNMRPVFPEFPRAESRVIRQNGGQAIPLGFGAGALWPAGNSLIALFDPAGPSGPAWFAGLQDRALQQNRFAALYKCSASVAVKARRLGWRVLRIADDAILDPASFSEDGSEKSRLRRKLRKAIKSGVVVRQALPSDEGAMQAIDANWQQRNGPARGGTMGQYCPLYVAEQKVLVAEWQGKIVAYVSWHRATGEWALDLMRDAADAPDGTMYLLVRRGIALAAEAQVARVSLAAIPADRGLAAQVRRRSRLSGGTAGLVQFKSAFAPTWQPLYLVAPGYLAMCVAVLDLVRNIHQPEPISPAPAPVPAPTLTNTPHEDVEYYEVASNRAA